MPQPQSNIHIAAPGFKGINTQYSPTAMDISYAATADNCIIDQLGRIASRKGFRYYTQNPEVLLDTTDPQNPIAHPIETVHEFISEVGTQYVFACGWDKIFSQTIGGTQNLVEVVLPVGYTVTGNDWQMVSFNDKVYFVQKGHIPLLFDPNSTEHDNSAAPYTLEEWDALPIPGVYPNAATAAFGHLWTADWDSGAQRVYWSDLLDGDGYGNTSGYFDLELFWPSGYDQVVAIQAHNNFLIVFGERSILVYNVPITGAPDSILVDTVEGIGCVARDSVQPTGTDVYFVDYTGVRSFARTIQEKSMPIGDVSINVRDDMIQNINAEPNIQIRAIYDPEDSFYAVFFPTLSNTYVFDTRQRLENGAFRPTRWPSTGIRCAAKAQDRETWYGGISGLYRYQDSNDVALVWLPPPDEFFIQRTLPIRMTYYTHPQTWDDPSHLKFPKQIDVTIIGSEELQFFVHWGFDYEETTNQVSFNRLGGFRWEYNVPITEYTVAEYSGASTLLTTEHFNLWGNGTNVQFGFVANLSGSKMSIQEINIQALTGRLI